ncbi:hypothetical protein BT69DRAFT_574154 [Atractiella rhizophila]|nr:hypothetical protein BT69DRAFT_574154 [Atractiella rhizophila]
MSDNRTAKSETVISSTFPITADCDLIIISGDGIAHGVRKILLEHYSKVFASMSVMPQPANVEEKVTPRVFLQEPAAVLEVVLKSVHGIEDSNFLSDTVDLDLLLDTVEAADKYDLPYLRQVCRFVIQMK